MFYFKIFVKLQHRKGDFMKNFARIFSFFMTLVIMIPFVSCSHGSSGESGEISITYESGVSKYDSNLRKYVKITFVQSVAPNEPVQLKSATELGWDNLEYQHNIYNHVISYWYCNESGSYKSYSFGETVQFSENITLQAGWFEKTCTITFNPNGGSISTETQTSKTRGFSLLKASVIGLYKVGYTFKGWSKSESEETVSFKDGAYVKFNDDITLYAVWEKSPNRTVTFNANNGSITTESQSIVEEVPTELETAETLGLTREGFIFKGWAKTATASVADYSDGEKITVSGDITLYAVWAYEATYTITFDVASGSISTNSQSETGETVTGEISATLKTADDLGLSRTGYKFKGWVTSNSSSTVAYSDGKSIKLSSDITLYAVWDKIVTYTITYDANGGYSSSFSLTETATGTESDGATLTLKTASNLGFSKDGYIFAGWSESSYASYASFNDGASVIVKRNTTFYAVWALPTYTVTYKQTNVFNSKSTTQTVTKGTITLPDASSLGLSRSGYTFLGWSTSSSSSSYYSAGQQISVTGNMTLYGVWKQVEISYVYVRVYHPAYSTNTQNRMYGDISATVGGYSVSLSGYSSSAATSSYSKIPISTGKYSYTTSYKIRYLKMSTSNYAYESGSKSGTYSFKIGGYYTINCITGAVTSD